METRGRRKLYGIAIYAVVLPIGNKSFRVCVLAEGCFWVERWLKRLHFVAMFYGRLVRTPVRGGRAIGPSRWVQAGESRRYSIRL